jgi:hypothetical protein
MKGKKTGGRKIGSSNYLNTEVKSMINSFVNTELIEITKRINELSMSERANFLIKLLPYSLPKVIDKGAGHEDFILEPLTFQIIGKDENFI